MSVVRHDPTMAEVSEKRYVITSARYLEDRQVASMEVEALETTWEENEESDAQGAEEPVLWQLRADEVFNVEVLAHRAVADWSRFPVVALENSRLKLRFEVELSTLTEGSLGAFRPLYHVWLELV